jgi:hypothetical protein
MGKTKLYAIYTDEVKEIKDIFLESIQDDWDVNVEYFGKAGEGNGDFLSKGWCSIQRRKVEFQISKIKENWGDVIVWSDVDIQFFSKGSDLIGQAISGMDVVYQAEYSPKKEEVNIGFAVIRCNERTLSLYESTLLRDIEGLPVADQTAINNILKENSIAGLKWFILPGQFWSMSHYLFNSSFPPDDVVLHHANCTVPKTINEKRIGSVELKLQQFDLVKKHVLSQRRKAVK